MTVSESVCLLEAKICSAEAVSLSPAQAQLHEELARFIKLGGVCVLKGNAGMGKSTVLRALRSECRAGVVSVKEFLALLMNRQPAALEETFLELTQQTLADNEAVFFDDFELLLGVVEGYDYPRAHLLDAVLAAILQEVEAQGKSLLFTAGSADVPSPISHRAHIWRLDQLKAEDYRVIASHSFDGLGDGVDWDEVHRFAPALNAYQIRNAARWLSRAGAALTTAVFTGHLQEHNLASNVDLEEVAPVDWKDLKGAADVIKELEAKITLPFENVALCKELKLKPKRGVLLAGPPGTGKTTIGRALAHRLKSKFFLIDGTVVADSNDFYETIGRIFAEAKRNAPAIIFIDDADVIFEDRSTGFYRYLLTQMDGLESASAERVCVILTAMEAGALPPAVLRSGRVELWLETRLPDESARAEILQEKLAELPSPMSEANTALLARASRGLTGADLKALVEDAKLLFAYRLSTGEPVGNVEDYFLRAIADIRAKAVSYGKRRRAGFAGSAIGFKDACSASG